MGHEWDMNGTWKMGTRVGGGFDNSQVISRFISMGSSSPGLLRQVPNYIGDALSVTFFAFDSSIQC